MQFTVIHATRNCDESTCPTIYINEAGNFVVQGFKIAQKDKAKINVPDHEDAIEVPSDFLKEFIEKMKI